MIQVTALLVSIDFIDAATAFVNVSWTAPNAPPPWNAGSSYAGFTIAQPFVSSLDQQNKIAAGLSAWLTINAGFTPSSVIVGLTQPAMDAKGRQYVKAAGLESRTYGRFGVPGDAFDVPIGTTVRRTYVLPFDVDLVDGTILLTGAAGDVARFVVAPQTPLNAVVAPGQVVPVLAAPIAIGDKQITLIAPYLAAFVDVALIDAGLFEIIVTDGVNTDAFGPVAAPGEVQMPLNVTGYDLTTGIVTLGSIRIWSDGDTAPTWAGFAHAYAVDAMVLVTRALVPRVELDGVSVLRVGEAAQSAAPIKAGIPIVLEYTRSAAATEATRVRVLFDVMTGQPG